jgi:2,5-diamino-6-(ribosylamino)-4(3H)-pyrimidinone 5'-phosphate reductase
MLPRIIIHNAISLDGRIDWLTFDLGLFYGLISRWNEDATMVGSNTLLKGFEELNQDKNETPEEMESDPKDQRPLLIVPDSKGRIRNWKIILKQPYWRGVVVLCCEKTPKEYLQYLKESRIEYLMVGKEHVNYKSALQKLYNQYQIKTIRLDSGGTLNGILLREGLVDEVSILIIPSLVGGTTPQSFFKAPDLTSYEEIIKAEIIKCRKNNRRYRLAAL